MNSCFMFKQETNCVFYLFVSRMLVISHGFFLKLLVLLHVKCDTVKVFGENSTQKESKCTVQCNVSVHFVCSLNLCLDQGTDFFFVQMVF